MSYDIDEYILSLDLVNYPEEEMRKVLNENAKLKAALIDIRDGTYADAAYCEQIAEEALTPALEQER